MVRREKYRFPNDPNRGIIALRDHTGWLWCELLLQRHQILDAGPYSDEEFVLVFEVVPEPISVEVIDLEVPSVP